MKREGKYSFENPRSFVSAFDVQGRVFMLILFHDLNVYKRFKQKLAYMGFAQNFFVRS